MLRLAFDVTNTEKKYVTLNQIPNPTISDKTWAQLSAHIAQEEGLSNYPPEILAARWLDGRSAIALCDGQIVAHISLVPVFNAATRARFAKALARRTSAVPDIEMYESATGWTHPSCRHRGISSQLRERLLEKFQAPNRLFVSVAVGLGASYVLPSLGWQMVSWSDLSFATALMGVPTVRIATPITIQRRVPPLKPYLGEAVTPTTSPHHVWADYSHFWLSDIDVATSFDFQLASLVDFDLAKWRELIAATHFTNPPESTWRAFLFDEYYETAPVLVK